MPKVNPIPEGMHSVTPHLVCDGAAKAIEFYKNAFGAEEVSRLPGPDGRIAHAEIRIGDSAAWWTRSGTAGRSPPTCATSIRPNGPS
jgi:uncharacterized glyoxalase superfamily protein PhnB